MLLFSHYSKDFLNEQSSHEWNHDLLASLPTNKYKLLK